MLPMLLRIGLLENIAYRAELFVWVLSTTMPFVMLALLSAVAADGPIGRFSLSDVRTYYLVTFAVRQLTGCWIGWQMNQEAKQGVLSARLLKPLHPVLFYAAETLGAIPLRLVVVLPAIAGAAFLDGGAHLSGAPLRVLTAIVAIAGGWAITFLANIAIGSLCFYLESTENVLTVWGILFFVFSGYLFPVELFPASWRAIVAFLPFRYQVGLGVEVTMGLHSGAELGRLLAAQWAWVLALLILSVGVFQRGLRRYAAYGG